MPSGIGTVEPKVQEVISDLQRMETERSTLDTKLQEISNLVLPIQDFNTERTPGVRRYDFQFDATAPNAAFRLASALHGQLTNPAAMWFKLRTRDKALDEMDAVRRKLDDDEERMMSRFNSPEGNFHNESHVFYLSLITLGTAIMFPTRRVNEDGRIEYSFQTIPLSSCYIKENDRGHIDTLTRKIPFTARQLVQRFGLENLPQDVQKKFKDKPETLYTVIHDVRPRKDRDRTKDNSDNKRFSSLWILKQGKKKLRESGFDSFPYWVARWTRIAGNVYGASVAMKALPDIQMINAMTETVIRAGQLAVRPPMLVPDDGFIGSIRATPGGLTYFRSGSGANDRIGPLFTGSDPGMGENLISLRQQAIERAFFLDLFRVVQSDRMTLGEFAGRKQEQLVELSPIVARIQSEFLSHAVGWLYEQMQRDGLLIEPPEELEGRELDIEYVSPLALSQRSSEQAGINQTMAFASNFAESGAMDNFLLDDLTRHVARLNNMQQRFIRRKEDVDSGRQAQAEQSQAQARLAQAGGLAEVLKEGAEAGKIMKEAQSL